MDFRDFAATELSTLCDRLATAHAEASIRDVRDALASAMRALDAAAAQRPDVDIAVNDIVKRLADAAEAATQRVRAEFDDDLTTIRRQADSLREELETESARAATLEADLDSVIEAHRQVDAERIRAEEALAEEIRARTAADEARAREAQDRAAADEARGNETLARVAAEEELRGMRDILEAARSEVASLQDALETEGAQKAAVESETAGLRATITSLEARIRSREEVIRELETRLNESQAREAALRTQAMDAGDLANMLRVEAESTKRSLADARRRAESAESALSAGRGRRGEAPAANPTAGLLLTASVRALDALSDASTISELMAAATRELASHFRRVALFRVKGNHLEGEHGAGLESTGDVAKLSIPLGLDSLITRAASTGSLQAASAGELADNPPPLGGQPVGAVAVPILFQGEAFAVAYADLDEPLPDSHRAFAALIAKQSELLLTRLTQEVRAIKELRDYAVLLLQEAEQMFTADLEGGRSEDERRQRLQETLDCARQMFAQRAALEGTTAASVLDDQILGIVTDPNGTPFAKELAAALAQSEGQRNAS